jgi:hypothetical protein
LSWDSVDSNKATEKQIKYAEVLLEACYGDINFPIYTMTKQEINVIIEETKKKCQEQNIEYHETEKLRRIAPRIIFDELYSAETARTTRRMTREELKQDIERRGVLTANQNGFRIWTVELKYNSMAFQIEMSDRYIMDLGLSRAMEYAKDRLLEQAVNHFINVDMPTEPISRHDDWLMSRLYGVPNPLFGTGELAMLRDITT